MIVIEKYLSRINYSEKPVVDVETLFAIHQSHVFAVPFENIDIRNQKRFSMSIDEVYKKIVLKQRGGFCYELNLLFHELLRSLGFSSHIISARIINGDVAGPEFDHMALRVDIGSGFLVDVGYGDLFVKPLNLTSGIQYDGRNYFSITSIGDNYMLSMSSNGETFEAKYYFSLETVSPDKFEDLCVDKQINPESYFVQNTVCTMPTPEGRITLFNNKFIETKSSLRSEQLIETDHAFEEILAKRFGIKTLIHV